VTPGVSIAWKDINPDTGEQSFEFVDGERDVFIVWHDKDGRLHATGFGPRVNRSDRRFDLAVTTVIELLRLKPDR
jgi:hypothetical protein